MANHHTTRVSSTIVAWLLFVIGTYSLGIMSFQLLRGEVVLNLGVFTALAGAGMLWNQQWARILGFAVCCLTCTLNVVALTNVSIEPSHAIIVVSLALYAACGFVIARDYLAYKPTPCLCENCGAAMDETAQTDEPDAEPTAQPTAN
jgi:hypothetical protein